MDVNLVLFKKDGSQKAFSVASDTTIIGRRHDCDLCIPAYGRFKEALPIEPEQIVR